MTIPAQGAPMANFKKILVPVDFSPHSAEAVRVAADIAEQYHGSITLVHVHDPLPYALPSEFDVFTPAQEARLIAEFEKRLAVTQRAAESAGAQRVETRLLHGQPSTAIVDAARSGQFDLIVMGTHGRTGIKHALLGSVAERVVRNAPCPVLTAKATE
jgi:nucleotide-binding universal stress UspA family protein